MMGTDSFVMDGTYPFPDPPFVIRSCPSLTNSTRHDISNL